MCQWITEEGQVSRIIIELLQLSEEKAGHKIQNKTIKKHNNNKRSKT